MIPTARLVEDAGTARLLIAGAVGWYFLGWAVGVAGHVWVGIAVGLAALLLYLTGIDRLAIPETSGEREFVITGDAHAAIEAHREEDRPPTD